MMKDLISIICTVKNGENTISQTIDSVINQSYKNWEFIIVDDGSSDNTDIILKEFSEKDKRVNVYFSGGIGRSKALNKAIGYARGEYISNIDADDLMHPQKLEIQIDAFNNNEVLFLLSTNYEIIFNDEKPKWNNLKKRAFDVKNVDEKLLIRNVISHPSVLMRKKELIELGKYNEKRETQIDYELWLRALLKGKKMGIISEKLIAKRIHTYQSYENKKRLRYTFNSMKLQLEYILKSRKNFFFLPIPIASFLLSSLPFAVRRNLVSKFAR